MLRIDSSNGVRSLGRTLLRQALEVSSVVIIATRVGCHHSTISRLANGTYISDSYRLRLALERAFGIPVGSWERPDEIDP